MSDLPDIDTPDVTLDFTDPLIGREFKGSYRVADKIGEGGFGSVYRAIQMVVNREVAIKVLRPERARDERLRDLLTKRFKREAVAMSKLSHPNTVQLIDFGLSDDGILFLVLELLKGRELELVIRKEAPIAPARVARIGQQICQSLGEAHQQGIIHRDLKPANIFLCDVEGNPDFVKVMDFGIARLVDPDVGDGQITRTGMTQGTPAYMAPEQAMAKETTAASDVYAVGCMMYEMLTGYPVFTAESAVAVGLAHVREKAPHLKLVGMDPTVVGRWDALLQRLLVKAPELRPQTTQEVVDELRELEELGGEVVRADAEAATVAVDSTPLHQAIAEAEDTDDQTELAQSSAQLVAAVEAADSADADQATQMAPAVSVPDDATQMAPAVSVPDDATQMAPAVSVSDDATQMAPAVSVPDQATQMAPAVSVSDEQTQVGLRIADSSERSRRAPFVVVLALTLVAGVTWALWPTGVEQMAPGSAEGAVEQAQPAETRPTPAAQQAPPPAVKEDVSDRTHLVLRSFPGQVLVHRGSRVLCTTPCDMYVKPGTAPESLVFRKNGYLEMSLSLTLSPGLLERTVQLAPAPEGTAEPATPIPSRVTPPSGTEARSKPKKRQKRPKKMLPGFRGAGEKGPAKKPAKKRKRALPKLRMGGDK